MSFDDMAGGVKQRLPIQYYTRRKKMAVTWTRGQREVIDFRGGNLLVSAAAGSGKTAVLVERIVEMVTDKDHPVDLDNLLVMTFTNAAAAEMRERIREAIEKRREADPQDRRLEMQSILAPRAQITTIDSFCLGLLREYYNHLDLDPAFRIGDTGELSLLKGDVMKELLEDWYGSGDQAFLHFAETYALGKSDFGIEDIIFQVWQFSQSHPWPEEWLSECEKELSEGNKEEIEKAPWMEFLIKDIRLQGEEMEDQLLSCGKICEEEGGPQAYRETILTEAGMMKECGQISGYEEFLRFLKKASFGKLPPVRSKDVDPEKKALVTSARDRVKKTVKGWKESFGKQPLDMVLEALRGKKETTGILLRLAGEFSRRFQEAKRERNLMDFNDLEHFALEILWEKGEERRYPSQVADELSRRFEEILVDEYQDSNLVQETLIQALSRERQGQPNVFMVGDVKQSIYRFRLARPELFLEKYETYSGQEGPYKKIELCQNFRSRASVLNSVNQVFYQIMVRNLGGIRYREETALYPGADFAPLPPGEESRGQTPTELLIVPTDSRIMEGLEEDAADYTARELEARLVAKKIKSLMDKEKGLLIWDKGKEAYRPAGFGDIVILLRSVSGWAEVLVNVLMNEGIPAAAQTQTGYFDTVEVETVLSLLSVVDNPFQDIPMACVLKSPVIGMTEEELAWLMAGYKGQVGKNKYGDRGIYGAVRFWLYGSETEEAQEPPALLEAVHHPEISRKLEKLETMLEEYRLLASWLPIHELIYQIYRRSGYYDYVSAMPAGHARQANLDMLAEKALAYENTSYKGLFHFIRYIEKLKKFETDFGEAPVFGENSQVVRIMSIHKSKGLEFPVVILAGMGKRFNKQDLTGKILIDPELGIAADYLELEQRVKIPTLKKQALKRRMDLETMGEELRILYVAMTRAKEKLIMTASEKSLDKKLEKWGGMSFGSKKGLPFTVLSGGNSYLDWMLMAFPAIKESGLISMETVPVSDLVGREVMRQIERRDLKEDLLSLDCAKTYEEEVGRTLKEQLSYEYPFQAETGLYAMLSVSEIKRRRQEAEAREEDMELSAACLESIRTPEGKGDKAKGALRGTSFHRALELISFGEFSSIENRASLIQALSDRIESFKEQGLLLEEEAGLIEAPLLAGFLRSPLGIRMALAEKQGRLHKEQQFMVGIPAREIGVGESKELVLVQGIIDAWMEEEDGLVLVDYKTDRVEQGGESILIRRYQTQLDYYKRSLEQITGKLVKEKILYSLSLGKEIGL